MKLIRIVWSPKLTLRHTRLMTGVSQLAMYMATLGMASFPGCMRNGLATSYFFIQVFNDIE